MSRGTGRRGTGPELEAWRVAGYMLTSRVILKPKKYLYSIAVIRKVGSFLSVSYEKYGFIPPVAFHLAARGARGMVDFGLAIKSDFGESGSPSRFISRETGSRRGLSTTPRFASETC